MSILQSMVKIYWLKKNNLAVILLGIFFEFQPLT